MRNSNLQKGYSLMELLIYVALFSILSVVIVNSLVTVMKTYNAAQAYRRLQSNGELVMERMTREIRSANSITAATYDSNSGSISISNSDSSGAVHSITMNIANGAVVVTDNGVSGSLTTAEVIVTKLILRHITSSAGEGVKIELGLSTSNGYSASAPFYSTVMLRGK